MNVLNDVAPFSVSFSQLPAVKKDTKNGAAVTSLRTLIRSSAFNTILFSNHDVPRISCLLYTTHLAHDQGPAKLYFKLQMLFIS